MTSTSLGDVLFTRTQQKVLGLLFGRPDESFYLNEIVRLAALGKGTVKRELDQMHAAGVITLKRIGNQNHYQANRECPIFEELLAIVRKTFGLVDVIKAALLELDSDIQWAFIYGSMAKGEDTASSDIDLMVLANSLAYAELMTVLSETENLLGRSVNPTIYDQAQLKRKLEERNAFLIRVMEQPKLWIKGTEDLRF